MMQLHVSGRLVRDPAQKTSASGKAYTHAMMVATSSDGDQVISLMAFDPELSNLLAGLRKGDNWIELDGERRVLRDWAGILGIDDSLICYHLKRGRMLADIFARRGFQYKSENCSYPVLIEEPIHAEIHTRFEIQRHSAPGRARTERYG